MGRRRGRFLKAGITTGGGTIASVNAGACIEIDATIDNTLINLITEPADGSAQADGDFTTLGDPSYAAGAFTLDSTDAIQLSGTNTACIQRMHQTNASEPYWFMVIYTQKGDDNGVIAGTGFDSTEHGYVARRNSTNDKLVMRNYNAVAQSLLSNDTGLFVSHTTYAFIYSADPQAGNDRYWINTTTKVEDTDTWVATTTDATNKLTLLNSAALDEGWASNVDFIYFALGQGYLDNAEASSIFSYVESKHGTDYTP